jgi:hypothetical protein
VILDFAENSVGRKQLLWVSRTPPLLREWRTRTTSLLRGLRLMECLQTSIRMDFGASHAFHITTNPGDMDRVFSAMHSGDGT